jgi:hypothetical protein
LLKLVDGALYAAKESGKNQARLYRPADDALSSEPETGALEVAEPELQHATAV